MASHADLTLVRGNTGEWNVTCYSVASGVLNLTGATLSWYIKSSASIPNNQALIVHNNTGIGGITVLDAGNGLARLTLQPAETSIFPPINTTLAYELIVTEADLTVTTVLFGAFLLTDPSDVPDTRGGYATIDDLSIYGLNAVVLVNLTPNQQIAALASASDLVDGYLNSKFKLPLISWGKGLIQKVCEIAAWTLLSIRGFDPEDPADNEVKIRYDFAIQWLKSIADGEITPIVVDSGTGQYGGPGILQSNTQPSSQSSPGGTLTIQTLQDGTTITTGAPRQRGWR